MPKERVRGTDDATPYGPDVPAVSVVEVGWHRDAEHVELASKCVRSDDGSDYVPLLEPLQFAPGELGELVELEAGPVRSGFYVPLDRRGVNELIRTLRRARDQAYGKDE